MAPPAVTGLTSNCVSALTPARWQVDQALVEVTSRVRLHSERSQAGGWARVSEDSEVRGVSEQRISEVTMPPGCPSAFLWPLKHRVAQQGIPG